MTLRVRCLVAGATALLATASAGRAQAQVFAGSPSASTTTGATLDFLWDVQPSSITVVPKSRARCSPGECFSLFVATRANARWQLQFRLRMPTQGFTVDLSTPASPALPSRRLVFGVWTPTNVTGIATRGKTAEVTLYTARMPGPSGRVPTVAELAPLLEWRVVPAP